MDAQLIVDGRVVALDEMHVAAAFQRLEAAEAGDILVALSHDERVLVRWIGSEAADGIAVIVRKATRKHVPPTKRRCPWLHAAVEVEFDHVAAEHGETIQALHASVNTEMTAKGRQPESYRRWLLKLKRRWVRAVVANGARVDDLETLASTM